MTPKETVSTAKTMPVSHVNSRGFLNPPVRVDTEDVGNTRKQTIKLAVQRCIDRMTHPLATSKAK